MNLSNFDTQGAIEHGGIARWFLDHSGPVRKLDIGLLWFSSFLRYHMELTFNSIGKEINYDHTTDGIRQSNSCINDDTMTQASKPFLQPVLWLTKAYQAPVGF